MAWRPLRRVHTLRGLRARCALPEARVQHRRARARPACLLLPRRGRAGGFPRSLGRVPAADRGEERRLTQWDFVHCPAWTEHVFVGAGNAPCAVLAVGTRSGGDVVYPASELAQRHRAGVERETHDPKEAYAAIPEDKRVPFDPRWLGG